MGKRLHLQSTCLAIGLVCSLSLSPSYNRAQDISPKGEISSDSISAVEPDKPVLKEAGPIVGSKEAITESLPEETGAFVEPKAAETTRLPEERGAGETDAALAPKEAETALESKESGTVAEPKETETTVAPKESDTVVGPRETDTVTAPVEKITAIEAEEPSSGGESLGLIFGFRTGLSIPTQKVIQDFGNSTSVGPLINVEALYAIREWVRVGLMLEWHRHSIKMWGPEFGTLNTVSILPTVEFRPTRAAMEERGIEAFIPYASLGLGINSNSLSKGSALGNSTVSFQDTFALRLAGGLDFPITSQWALNAEVAWNKNSGDFQLNATDGRFNASTLNLLVGIRAQF